MIEFKNLTSEKVNKVQLMQSSDNILKARKPISWGKIVKEKFKKELWYQMGYRNKTTYMRIGCKARYTINYNDLSKWQIRRCEWYSKSIRYCNNYMNRIRSKVDNSLLVTGVVSFILALMNAALGPAGIAIAVTQAFNLGKDIVDLFQKAAKEYSDADYFYGVIKHYA